MRTERVAQLKNEIPLLLARYGIPPRFIVPAEIKSPLTLDVVKKGVCLVGPVGVGKTMAVCTLVRDWLMDRAENAKGKVWGDFSKHAWRFIVYPEFIMQIQDAFKNKRAEETSYEMLEDLAKVPLLIIDDLGAEKPTEYVRQATYYVINHREMNLLPTFITTNFAMDFLNENLDPRISSRIAGMCEIVRLDGKDRRLPARNRN